MAIKKVSDEELWITNVSPQMDVSLADLRITVRRGQSLNLLAKDKKGRSRWNFSREQVDKSILDGSIAQKNSVIKIRKVPPVTFNTRLDIQSEASSRDDTRFKRKVTEIAVEQYPDLDFESTNNTLAEEKFAAETAEMDFLDRAPAIPVDPKFKKLSDDDE